MLEVTEVTFEKEVMQETRPVLVDFWSPGCGPCRTMLPVLQKIEDAYGGAVKVCKIDASQETLLAKSYDVHHVPKFVVFKNGEPVGNLLGVQTEKALRRILDDDVYWTMTYIGR